MSVTAGTVTVADDGTASGSGLAAANLALLSLDFHVQVEKGGTTTEIPA